MAKWVYLHNRADEAGISSASGNISRALLDILAERGISPDLAEDFLARYPKLTYDPFLMPDLREAVLRIIEAADSGLSICIYGDYDADGITSTALLKNVIGRLTDKLCYYIPSRFVDGYGLNRKGLSYLHEHGAQLIVTVDCGSTSREEVEYAKSLGMEMIVSDHHTLCDDKIPDCLLINPKRSDSKYPFNGLSGCGVAFKMAQGVQRILEERGDTRFTKKDLNELLDLVAISTVADVVPLLDENRSLVKYGLAKINSSPRPGLKALLEELGCSERQISAENIAFILAPNINALGRMGSARTGVELLASDGKDGADLRALSRSMIENNQVRKSEQERTRALCQEAMQATQSGDFCPVIFVPDAHEGVTGIVAGNLKEELYRPVCILTPDESGMLKGTGRCIPGLNLYDMLQECGDLFLRFGGHAGACGFCLYPDKVDEFRRRMQDAVKKRTEGDPDLLVEKIYIEKELAPEEKCIEFADELAKLEPFGQDNLKPLFSICGARVSSVHYMGKDGQHVRFTADNGDRRHVDCVLFRRAQEFAPLIESGERIDIAGELAVNEFGGTRRLQFTVRDIKKGQC